MLVAVTLLVVIVVMLVAMTLLAVIVVMLVAVTLLVVIVVMLVMVAVMLLKLAHCVLKGISMLHRGENIRAREHIPRSGDEGGGGVCLSDEGGCLLYLKLLCRVGVGEYDGGRVLKLVAKELAEIFHIHLALAGVNHGGETSKLKLGIRNALHRTNDVGKLANARRLYEYSIGVILGKDLSECL